MRQVQDPQLKLGSVGIEEIRLNPKSRDDIPAILLGLQHLYADVDLRARLFALLEQELCPGVSLDLGRPGLELWKIVVMGVAMQGLGCDFDRLHELVNEHRTLRKFLGHATDWDETAYEYQTVRRGSALKHYLHYLYRRGTQLVVPAVVAEECERHLTSRAMGKKKQIQEGMERLARYIERSGGWAAPSNDAIEERAKELAAGDDLGAILLSETEEVGMRADLRDQAERPPSHRRGELADCRIWEHPARTRRRVGIRLCRRGEAAHLRGVSEGPSRVRAWSSKGRYTASSPQKRR